MLNRAMVSCSKLLYFTFAANALAKAVVAQVVKNTLLPDGEFEALTVNNIPGFAIPSSTLAGFAEKFADLGPAEMSRLVCKRAAEATAALPREEDPAGKRARLTGVGFDRRLPTRILGQACVGIWKHAVCTHM
jgi:hypothetical protein